MGRAALRRWGVALMAAGGSLLLGSAFAAILADTVASGDVLAGAFGGAALGWLAGRRTWEG